MSRPAKTPSMEFGIFKDKKLPKSCIESSLHVIQCINANAFKPWVNSETTTEGVGVWAVFGNKMICVNRVLKLQDKLTNVTELGDVVKMLKVGRGIALGNSKTGDTEFNMHFGAVLSGNLTKLTLTDLSEDGLVTKKKEVFKVTLSKENVLVTNSSYVMSRFRGEDYKDSEVFKAGLLISEDDKAFAEIKKSFSAENIIDGPKVTSDKPKVTSDECKE